MRAFAFLARLFAVAEGVAFQDGEHLLGLEGRKLGHTGGSLSTGQAPSRKSTSGGSDRAVVVDAAGASQDHVGDLPRFQVNHQRLATGAAKPFAAVSSLTLD